MEAFQAAEARRAGQAQAQSPPSLPPAYPDVEAGSGSSGSAVAGSSSAAAGGSSSSSSASALSSALAAQGPVRAQAGTGGSVAGGSSGSAGGGAGGASGGGSVFGSAAAAVAVLQAERCAAQVGCVPPLVSPLMPAQFVWSCACLLCASMPVLWGLLHG